MEKIYKDFGKYLKIKRIEADMSQQEVADKLGITHNAYGYYERGVRKVSLNVLLQLADVLKFEPGEFLNNYDD